VLGDKNLSPPIQAQIKSVESLLKAAQATPDANRPAIMAAALKLIDSAFKGLFTTPAP
jgi:hypothetical protein